MAPLRDVLPPATVNDLPVLDADTASVLEPLPIRSYSPTKWDIFMLGISIGLGGQYFSWNSGLHAGLYTFMIDFVVVGFAYVALCCCTSEITGALPFAGGAYGLSRCTLGYYPGFLIGCAEACEYIAYVSASVMSLGNMVVECVPHLKGYEPAIWLAVYGHACYVHYRGDRVFWRWNFLIGSLSFVIVLIYVFGSIPHVDFANNADNDPDFRFVNGMDGFLKSLPLACWFFVGVEALSLASDDVKDAPREIPFAQIACILTLFALGVVVFFVTVSLPPPGLRQVAKLLAPFDNGFHNMFTISLEMSTLFSIPAMYATTFGFMWGYGKLISAMATSKLLPSALARNSDKYDTPISAVLVGTAFSYALSLIVFFVPTIEEYLYNVCIAAAFLGYAGQCVGYISIKQYYPALAQSKFRSPFGIAGAVYSLAVWVLGLVSVACFQDRNGTEFLGFVCLIALLSLFYVLYAKKHQTFSEQESKVFLMAHVMKFNRQKVFKRQLVDKNPPRRRFRHIHAKHTPVVHADPAADGEGETRKTSLPRATMGGHHFGDSTALRASKPLALPVAKWLPYATPFHRYFTNPQLVEAKYAATKRKETAWVAVVPGTPSAAGPAAPARTQGVETVTTLAVVAPVLVEPVPSLEPSPSKRTIAYAAIEEEEGDEEKDEDDAAQQRAEVTRARTPVQQHMRPGEGADDAAVAAAAAQ